jgi:3-oxoacyl-[acyl-carrier protein] reductase
MGRSSRPTSATQRDRALAVFAGKRSIDILVNNAGSLIARTRVLDFTENLWEKVLMLNFTSAFFLSQAVLHGMVERKRGYIVNISSVAARLGGGLGALAYSAAKAAVSTMTKGLTRSSRRWESASIASRPVRSIPATTRPFPPPKDWRGVRAATPVGRLGTAEEIADAVVFLCSDQARFIHGQVIEINGGFLMA